MTGMRQKWDEWHRNDGMRPSLRQPNFHLIQLILMSFVSFWHHPIAVYNGDDSLMTPKWGPRQDRSWQLSLSFSFWNIIQSILLVFDVSPKESLDVFWMFAGQPCGRLKKWPNQHWTWRGGGGQMKGKIKNRCYDRGCNCVTLYFLKIQNSLMGCEFGKTCYNCCNHDRDRRDNVYDKV